MALRDYLAGEIAQDCTDGLLIGALSKGCRVRSAWLAMTSTNEPPAAENLFPSARSLRSLTLRESLRRLGLLGFSLASASGLLAACGDDGASENDDDAAGSTTTTSTEADPSTSATVAAEEGATITFAGPQGELTAAFATPEDPTAGLLVIHENRGLTAHFRDLVNRFAGEGYAALSLDLPSAEGGTDGLADPGAAPAAAPFYGPAPDPSDFSEAEAAVLAVYAELDARVNASRDRAEAALASAGLTYEIRTFPGVDHAFFNGTGPRCDEAAAGEANQALLDWFAQHLT